MEKTLFIINSNFSSRTSKFWKKHEREVTDHFPGADVFILDVIEPQKKIDLNNYQTIIIVGDDSFYSRVVNFFFPDLNKQIISFIPDSHDSSICCGLNYPLRLSKKIELIKTNHHIPLDVIKAHYINRDGLPDNRIIINDAIIGIPPMKIPLLIRTILQWLRSSSIIPFTRSPNVITLVQNETILYSGRYLMGLILLGNKITKGPKIRNKSRFNLAKFDYYQLNSQLLFNMTISLTSLFSPEKTSQQNILREKIEELEMKAIGNAHSIIADGIYIGRLPASFTILPKAINVISPLNVMKIGKPWKSSIVGAPDLPTPISQQDCLSEEYPNQIV